MAEKRPKKNGKVVRKRSMMELSKGLPRKEEEQYLLQFSSSEHNGIMLIVLAATFIVQGMVRYMDAIGKLDEIRPWFFMVMVSFLLLISSVVSIILSNVISPLRIKRTLGVTSFWFFIAGFLTFFTSLIFLMFII